MIRKISSFCGALALFACGVDVVQYEPWHSFKFRMEDENIEIFESKAKSIPNLSEFYSDVVIKDDGRLDYAFTIKLDNLMIVGVRGASGTYSTNVLYSPASGVPDQRYVLLQMKRLQKVVCSIEGAEVSKVNVGSDDFSNFEPVSCSEIDIAEPL